MMEQWEEMKMKAIFGWLAVVAALAATLESKAALSVLRNDVLWDATMEGAVFPTVDTPAWSYASGGSASGGSDGSSAYFTSFDTSFQYLSQTDSTWTSAGSARTIEFRAQVTAQTASDRAFDVLVGMADGDYWTVRLSSNGVQLAGSIPIGSETPVDNSTFHTYRLVIADSLAVDQAKLFLDGNAVPISTSGANVPATGLGNQISIGDLSSGGVGGTTYVDFLSWTNGYFEVPEPSSGLLAGITGLLFLRKRRTLQRG